MGAPVSNVWEDRSRIVRGGEQSAGLFPEVQWQIQGQWTGSFKKREEQGNGAFLCYIRGQKRHEPLI